MVLNLPETSVNGHEPGKYLHWAVPDTLDLPQDQLMLRLDFYSQSVVMQRFKGDLTEVKQVAPIDVAEALTNQLDFTTGLLPPDTLWMTNTKLGGLYSLWCEPGTRILSLQHRAFESAERYKIPLPGLIFLCLSGRPPWVYAASKRPMRTTDVVYHAPFFNVFSDGRVCPGDHKFPEAVHEIPESFFLSFFSREGNPAERSKAYPKDLRECWQSLEGKRRYPLRDLVRFGTVQDLLRVEVTR